MTDSAQFSIVRFPTTPLHGSTQEARTESLERMQPTPLNHTEVYKTHSADTPSNSEFETYKATIYGSSNVVAPNAGLSRQEREQHIGAYAKRVNALVGNIERGSEGERNLHFQNARSFMEPAGYFSAGLLAAGLDPHEKITVTFTSYVGMGRPEHQTNTDKRTYFAWEISAGALAHDKVERGGPVNFQFMEIESQDLSKVNDLESLGSKLQNHWEDEIAKPMREASGKLASRSGKADSYVVRGTLQSLLDNEDVFKELSPDAQTAIKRTLHENGQVIIPNIYGYPMSRYAFIPYSAYDGNYKHRPNKGVMIDLKNGAVNEIKGDQDFASWAKKNRDDVQRSFNASDRQGGKDAHWASALNVLDNLVSGVHAHYPGYYNLVSDQAVPVLELFNYTASRAGDYHLKYGSLDSGVAQKYQEVNAKNAVWADQTEVFGSSQQNWKAAKDFWSNTFGYLPVIGNTGNIVFGVHDSIYGMTAEDRVGGNAAAVISGLQLVHELIPEGAQDGLADLPLGNKLSTSQRYGWEFDSQVREFELVRKPTASLSIEEPPVSPKNVSEGVHPDKPPLSFSGMREIEYEGKKYFVAEKPDAGDGQHYLLRIRDPKDPDKLGSSGKIAAPDAAGVWRRRGVSGGNQTMRLKERIAGSTLQRPATPEQILELRQGPDGRYALTSQHPKRPETFMADGAYVFVIRADDPDKVYLGSVTKGLTSEGKPYAFNRHTNPNWVEGHSALSGGLKSLKGGTTDVAFAGTVYIKNGQPEFWTNSSGHYQPSAELRHTNLSPAAKKLLPEEKFVAENKMTAAQRKSWAESTHLTKAEQRIEEEFVKLAYGAEDDGSDLSDED